MVAPVSTTELPPIDIPKAPEVPAGGSAVPLLGDRQSEVVDLINQGLQNRDPPREILKEVAASGGKTFPTETAHSQRPDANPEGNGGTPPPEETKPPAGPELAPQSDGTRPGTTTETTSPTTTAPAPHAAEAPPAAPPEAPPTTGTEEGKTPTAQTNPPEAPSPSETPPPAATETMPEDANKDKERLKNLLKERRETVRSALREMAKILLKHKDPLVIAVVQAIGASDSAVGDQLREAILARAKQVCDMEYPKDTLNVPENIVTASPLTTEGIAVENTPLADLLVDKIGMPRKSLHVDLDTTQEQTEAVYRHFINSEFRSVLGEELFGDDWKAKLNVRNTTMLQLFSRFIHGEGLKAFNFGTGDILADMLHTGEEGTGGTKKEARGFNITLFKSQMERTLGGAWAKRHGIMESPYVHIGLLVFMTLLQTAQQSGREGPQAPER